jgi:pimeloyl-ACP methyl ester carboxylesterase
MSDGELVDVGDVTLFVRELGVRGDRPSLVVLHGGPDVGHGYLLPGVEPLARDHHVVLFDFRGCGRSSRGLPDEALEPEYVVQDAHRLIGKLGLGQVDLLGFSTGGRAAMQFVDKHPEQVRRLILASTTAYTGADIEQYLTNWDEYQRRQRAEDAANGALRNSTVFVWDRDLAPGYLALLNSLGSDTGDWSEERAINGTMHPWCPGDPEHILRTFNKPILILHGDKDMGFPVQLAHRLHAAVPTSHLAVIPNTAHLCHFEKPDVWAASAEPNSSTRSSNRVMRRPATRPDTAATRAPASPVVPGWPAAATKPASATTSRTRLRMTCPRPSGTVPAPKQRQGRRSPLRKVTTMAPVKASNRRVEVPKATTAIPATPRPFGTAVTTGRAIVRSTSTATTRCAAGERSERGSTWSGPGAAANSPNRPLPSLPAAEVPKTSHSAREQPISR